MISRRSARIIAEAYESHHSRYHSTGTRRGYYTVDQESLYDFLFDNDYDGWFCNVAQSTYTSVGTRNFKEFIMKLHTGESIAKSTPDWSWEQRQKLGQRYLHDLAEDMLNYRIRVSTEEMDEDTQRKIDELLQSLRLDGFEYNGSKLLTPETDVLDVQEESGVLESIYGELRLENRATAFHHLRLSEEHYLAERWDDSIANSRKFLECVLSESAVFFASYKNAPLSEAAKTRPAQVREFLEREGLLEKKEREAIASVYALLSETGGHPYMAQGEQARLLRHLALTFSQFVMLRLRGKLSAEA